MNLDIFNDFYNWANEVVFKFRKFIDNNYNNPLLWAALVIGLLAITCYAVKALSSD